MLKVNFYAHCVQVGVYAEEAFEPLKTALSFWGLEGVFQGLKKWCTRKDSNLRPPGS